MNSPRINSLRSFVEGIAGLDSFVLTDSPHVDLCHVGWATLQIIRTMPRLPHAGQINFHEILICQGMRTRISCWNFLKSPVKTVFVREAATIQTADCCGQRLRVHSSVTYLNRDHSPPKTGTLFGGRYLIQTFFKNSVSHTNLSCPASFNTGPTTVTVLSSVRTISTCSCRSLFKRSNCHNHLTCRQTTGTRATGFVVPPVAIGAKTYHLRLYSTNSTSVCPPPTPSTQSECLATTAEADSLADNIQIPEPPNNCCMSGCANCVWITYAQELAQLYKDGGKAADSVMNAIDDPSLKVFLNLELNEKLRSNEED